MEAAAFASGRATASELMERAGQAVVDAILHHWPGFANAPPPTLVLCGPGNNGGDGYVVARLLRGLGWPVAIRAIAPPRSPEAQLMRQKAEGPDAPGPHTLVIDALLGFRRPRPFDPGDIGPDPALRVAIDVPTGLDADTGTTVPPAMQADLTVTFHAAKPGHYLRDGPARCGRLHVADLGLPLPETALHLAAPNLGLVAKTGGHKYGYGHAVVLSGPPGHGGAARLAARAALRIGAGLVTIAAPAAAQAEHAARLDAIMLRCADTDLSPLLEDRRISALCLGPGFGVDRARDALPSVLAARRATVLDADALTALGTEFALHDTCVLTPHQGEFARLFPDLAETIPKTEAVRKAAARAGCTVLLKGHDTTIADPSGRAVIVDGRGAEWLATAGAGDVLAGMIAGLLARGADPFNAAQTAACLHVGCARSFGPGLIAEDIAEELPKVFRTLLP